MAAEQATAPKTRPRTGRVLGLDSPSMPPLRSHVTVPFLWEEAPGKPKVGGSAASGRLSRPRCPSLVNDDGGVTVQEACHVPLKLPPRLQTAEYCWLSPKSVLHGPYCGGALRRSGSTAGFRAKLGGAAGELFSWRKATGRRKKDGFELDGASSCCSSSSSSSSTVPYDDDGASGSVRIRRLRRNTSLPTMTTWHLLANIRRSVRQINPWSNKA